MHLEISGSGDPIVLLHGVPGSSAVWHDVRERLVADHRVVVADLLGFGDSDRPTAVEDLWTTAQADALETALDAVGLERAVVVGHDFGGPVALRLAASAPERVAAVGLLAANVFADTPVPPPISAVRWPIVGGVAGRVLFSGPSLRLMLRKGASTALDAGVWLGDEGQRRSIATVFAHALRHLDAFAAVEADLRALEAPVSVLWGDADPFFAVDQAQRTADAARRADVTVLEDAGHFLPAERPDAVADVAHRLAERARVHI